MKARSRPIHRPAFPRGPEDGPEMDWREAEGVDEPWTPPDDDDLPKPAGEDDEDEEE